MRVDIGDPQADDRPTEGGAPHGTADRLVMQLNTLTEVVETLTYRLLELEEALAVQQSSLEAACGAVEGWQTAAVDANDVRLDETEQRLSRVETLLKEVAPSNREETPESGLIDAPFSDEGEQPFMDDWSEAVPA